MRSALFGIVAAAILLLVLVPAPVVPPTPAASTGASGNSSPDIDTAALNLALGLAGISPGEYAAASTWWHGLTVGQQQQALAASRQIAVTHQFPAALARQLGLVSIEFNWYCLGTSVVAGAAVGGIVGNFVGAIVGAVAGAIAGYFLCQDSSTGPLSSFPAWSQTQINGLANEANLTFASYGNLISALNLSKVGWERAADHAAILQIGNSSFNTSLDLMQSGTFANLAPVWSALAQEEANIFQSIVVATTGNCGTGALYASKNCAVSVSNGGSTVGGGPPPSTIGSSIVGSGALFSGNANPVFVNVWIPNGANISMLAGDTLALKDEETGNSYNFAPQAGCPGPNTGWCTEIFGGPSALYTAVESSGKDFFIANGQLAPTSASSPIDGQGAGSSPTTSDGFSVFVPGTTYTSCSAPLMRGTSGGSTNSQVLTACSTGLLTMTGTGAYGFSFNPLSNAIWINLQAYLSAIEWDAATNAQAYWQFLRAIGYTSPGQIPPNCIVPAPYLVMPSQLQGVSLNVTQWWSLYLSTLQDMGNFYNVSLSSVSFCGTQSTHDFKLGSEIWGNLFVNATGYVYLNNGTSPIGINGKALATESFKNTSTWAVGISTPCSLGFTMSRVGNLTTTCTGAEQLFLMPTLGTVSIPIGIRWAVPTNDPIQIYAIQSGQEILATGNGTGSGACPVGQGGFCPQSDVHALGTLAPGDSIYLTSCTVGGSASSNCTVTVQTLNVTVTRITCNGPCSQGSPAGVFGGFPNPFSWLANLLGGLFGGGPLGQFLGSLLAGILIFVGILVLIYIAVKELEAWGRRKSSGTGTA